jgi:tripartite-type tricarboxylate transporter receptor subunit TctC
MRGRAWGATYRGRLGAGLACCAAMLLAGVANAQTWPVRPVRMIVPLPAGGGADIVARTIAPTAFVSR